MTSPRGCPGGGPLVFDHDPHWNADGHALVADVLAAFVRERASNREGEGAGTIGDSREIGVEVPTEPLVPRRAG